LGWAATVGLSANFAVGARALLYDVRKFVRYQASAFDPVGRVFTRAKKEITAGSEGSRSQVRGGAGCARVGVNPDSAQVETEARLKESARRWRQGLAAVTEVAEPTLQRGINYVCSSVSRLSLDRFFFLFLAGLSLYFLLSARAALPLDLRYIDRSGDRLNCRQIRHAHDAIGNPVSFPLVGIVGFADFEFRLNVTTERLIPDPLVQFSK